MSGGLYGGDEVGAVVFDIGTNTSRVGFAGEDSPKGEISTTIGAVLHEQAEEKIEVDGEESEARPSKNSHKRYQFDPQHFLPIANKEMVNPIKDCMIEDWNVFENLMDFLYKNNIRDKSEAHPVLMSEAPWNTKEKREKLTELMFEKYEIPAFFLCKNAVLSAFSVGRSTGLIVDSGATHTSAVPVHDGYVLQKGIVRSPVAGDVLAMQCQNLLDEMNIDTTPTYMIKSKEVVNEEESPSYKLRELPELTSSFKSYMKKQLSIDFMKTVLQVSDSPFVKSELETVPSVLYEFPTGYTKQIGIERFSISESLFDTSHITNLKGFENTTLLGAPHVINTSIGMCDIDIRPGLYSSLIVVGGTTLLNGFIERLNRELLQKTPNNMRLKLVSNNQAAERRFSTWIGGSILGSLGSFQQMWISKQEYQEQGKVIIEKKCP